MAQQPGIFPTFLISGFECSTFLCKDKQRRNLIQETQHDRYPQEDYQLLRSLGIDVAREAIPWPLVDHWPDGIPRVWPASSFATG